MDAFTDILPKVYTSLNSYIFSSFFASCYDFIFEKQNLDFWSANVDFLCRTVECCSQMCFAIGLIQKVHIVYVALTQLQPCGTFLISNSIKQPHSWSDVGQKTTFKV